MKSTGFRVLFFLLASASALFAQTAQVGNSLESNLRKHVEYLASEKLEGRRTGEPGATAAAGYIANQFAKFKLKPGLKNGKANFLQTFPYVSGVSLGKDNFLRIIPADATRENKMQTSVNWMPLGFSPNGYVPPAPLVFAGYGIASDELKYDDYAGLDVKDKVVLIFDGTPDAANPHSQFARFNIHTKANIAKEKGAKGIIVIAADANFKNDRLSALTYDRTSGETALPVAAIARDLGGELLGVTDEKGLAELEKKQAETRAVASVPFSVKATVQLKVDLTKRTTEAYNVIGIVGGNDPVLKNEAIVIGAHYDHLGRGGQGSLAANSTEIHFGADDNASGTAAVLELARMFSGRNRDSNGAGLENKRTIIFIAFGGEEEGLLGSKYYVNNPVWPLDKTIAMINLDMVGRLNENKLNVGGIGTASEWRALLDWPNVKPTISVNDTTVKDRVLAGLKSRGIESVVVEVESGQITLRGWAPSAKYVEAIQVAAENSTSINNQLIKGRSESVYDFQLSLNEDGFGPSDHSSFYSKQIPVLFFFTGTHLDYHKPSDTFEKINYDGLTNITNFVASITQSVDANKTRPTYKVAQSTGMGGRMAFNVSLGTIPSYGDTTDGLVLDGVRDGSPAAKAGLKAGDKIVKLAGKDVRNAMDYTYVLSTMKAGEEYEVIIKRGAETLTLKIIPAAAARRP